MVRNIKYNSYFAANVVQFLLCISSSNIFTPPPRSASWSINTKPCRQTSTPSDDLVFKFSVILQVQYIHPSEATSINLSHNIFILKYINITPWIHMVTDNVLISDIYPPRTAGNKLSAPSKWINRKPNLIMNITSLLGCHAL